MNPIHPTEIKPVSIPDSVVSAFNCNLGETAPDSEGWKIISQGSIVDLILLQDPTMDRHDLFDKGYMDVEDLFRQHGWEVRYQKGFHFANQKSYFHFRPLSGYS